MNRKKHYILSAASILVILTIVIIIRTRGRKVYLKQQYRLNNNYYIWLFSNPDDAQGTDYFNGTLEYVIIDRKEESVTSKFGNDMIKIKAIGWSKLGRIVRTRYEGYINTNLLDLNNN